jgi:hypothetical protein
MRSVKNVIALVLAASTLVISGCASIVGDSQYPVAVMPSPDNAHFEVRNQSGMLVQAGTTPTTVILPSSAGFFDGETYSIKYTKDGLTEQTVTLDSKVSGWYWGNVAIGGIIGMLIVDPTTGAMYKLPDSVTGTLQSSGAATTSSLSLVTVDTISAEQRTQLVPVQ